jgi:hypothetical protein
MDRIKVWFFAGGEAGTEKLNAFTGSYIRLMQEILQDDFEVIRGIYFKMPMFNVIWSLNHSQEPLGRPMDKKFIRNAFQQITSDDSTGDTKLILTSSSSGSVIAAQTACCLAEQNSKREIPVKPFDIALGASMIATNSDLFKKLEYYRDNGLIGSIIFDDLQDNDDTTLGIGGRSRREAYSNAFGLMFPVFSKKFHGPSFLNTHPENGHVHRKRSKTVQKAIDFIDVLLIKHKLAGSYYSEKAAAKIKEIENQLG